MSIKVAVGMSGGVDSSVSALLLKNAEYEVTGVHMKCWDGRGDGCTADKDRSDAVSVASMLNIKFEALDFVQEYKQRVIDYFYAEYKKGRTPNPDVMCNKEIKFGLFLDWAMQNGFDYIATGHYARTQDGKLLKGIDASKDQSYFLYPLSQNQLSKVFFPVGAMKKTEVRKIAREAAIPVFDKPDSMGICFVGEVNIKEFLKARIKEVPGEVIDASGEVVGTHSGVWFYTIGQRHGFNVEKYVGLPLYVIGKNVEKNQLIVGFAKDAQSSEFLVGAPHWIGEDPLDAVDSIKIDVRVRHLGHLHKAVLNKNMLVSTETPINGVAPGQSAVFYQGDVVLGGAVIS